MARWPIPEILEDDIERTALTPRPDLLLATLLLEHIAWPRGVEAFARLQPRTPGVNTNDLRTGAIVVAGRTVYYAGPTSHSRSIATSRIAFLVGNRVQRPNQRFSKLNHPAHRYPYLRFNLHLAMLAARLGAKMDSLSPFL